MHVKTQEPALNLMQADFAGSYLRSCHHWRQAFRSRLSFSIGEFISTIVNQIRTAEFTEVDAYMTATERA